MWMVWFLCFMQSSFADVSIRFVFADSLTCPKCNMRFNNFRSRMRHLNVCYNEVSGTEKQKKFKCDECSSRFMTFAYLQSHTMVVHRGVSQFMCRFCNKAFTTALILENHIRTHTGDRPFKCTTCGRGFAQKSTLMKHVKTHLKVQPVIT